MHNINLIVLSVEITKDPTQYTFSSKYTFIFVFPYCPFHFKYGSALFLHIPGATFKTINETILFSRKKKVYNTKALTKKIFDFTTFTKGAAVFLYDFHLGV